MQAVTIKDLRKVYANGTVAVDNVSLSINQGDFFALLGPNGAGKSTTIGILTSLVTKTAGQVSIFGYDIDTQLNQAKQCIGLVPQEFNCSIFEKVIDILLYQAGYYGISHKLAMQQAEYYLKKLNLWDQRNRASMLLSGGMKRRLMIARALVHLVHEPKLLILDEPTAGLDIELRGIIWSFLEELNRQGTTIILTTHYLEEAENHCKNVAIINNGKIAEDTSMHALLDRLKAETFICDLHATMTQLPQNSPFNLRYISEQQIEADLPHDKSLNDLFEYFKSEMIEVRRMKNKANRLETLFLNLIDRNNTVGNTSDAK